MQRKQDERLCGEKKLPNSEPRLDKESGFTKTKARDTNKADLWPQRFLKQEVSTSLLIAGNLRVSGGTEPGDFRVDPGANGEVRKEMGAEQATTQDWEVMETSGKRCPVLSGV